MANVRNSRCTHPRKAARRAGALSRLLIAHERMSAMVFTKVRDAQLARMEREIDTLRLR